MLGNRSNTYVKETKDRGGKDDSGHLARLSGCVAAPLHAES
jgi:hypothetical protein